MTPRYNNLTKELLENNVSGGVDSAFGSVNNTPIGNYGNQFPAQNDNAYAPGDARNLFGMGVKRKKKKKKIKMQRRRLIESVEHFKVGDIVEIYKPVLSYSTLEHTTEFIKKWYGKIGVITEITFDRFYTVVLLDKSKAQNVWYAYEIRKIDIPPEEQKNAVDILSL
jgi:ribosomal protein L21E